MRASILWCALVACHGAGGRDPGDDTEPGGDAGGGGDIDGSGADEFAVVLAAGDIASSDPFDADTAALVAARPGTVLVLGDNAYSDGAFDEFMAFYEPTWGAFKDRTRPVPGNHDYRTTNAAGYFKYFGEAAGDPSKGYYSYDLGNWHLIALNTNGEDACDRIACGAGSAQEQWLRADLAASTKPCTLAYWHHPRWSSGSHGSDVTVDALWRALHEGGVEIALVGHDHDYERMQPIDGDGALDEATGLVEIVVGTGGRDLRGFDDPPLALTAKRDGETWGVLQLKLFADRAEYEFVPIAGQTFTDTGVITCH